MKDQQNTQITHPLWQAIGIGVIAGSRSMTGPALAAHILRRHDTHELDGSALRFLRSGTAETAFKLMALAEFVGDKMPTAPDRIGLPGLIGRFATGALAGAAMFKAGKRNTYLGAMIGGGAAILSTYGTFYLRKSTVKSSKLIDPVIGALEDALVLSAGAGLAKAA
ncbi:DUF4126 family protein [Mucilaginibacter daejeonensis]|uniref:DUF4126 family protein n=1 Tax=Mucilaginibacter daejeonensis TaxID=398049 RepID=UPI001D17AC77|nr:DUF4126 family protein [Mucilaginibacter daejeonensis]UEG55135.1 DUF4126 family protein [Mucilaginibacter daejeonensis]